MPITQEQLDALNEHFENIQKRDGLPDSETGQTHCRSCHAAYASTVDEYAVMTLSEPSCGHWIGCPEC